MSSSVRNASKRVAESGAGFVDLLDSEMRGDGIDFDAEIKFMTEVAADQLKTMAAHERRHSALSEYIEANMAKGVNGQDGGLVAGAREEEEEQDAYDKQVTEQDIAHVYPEFKRTNTYKAGDNILFVGEGNFSYTRAFVAKTIAESSLPTEPCGSCFALPFMLTTTCLHSREEVLRLHPTAAENIEYLELKGVSVEYSVDATKLIDNYDDQKFELISFNFPHIGGKSNIKLNRELLKDYFNSASEVLADDNAYVSVSLCQGQGGIPVDSPVRIFADSWQVVSMASSHFILDCIKSFENISQYTPTGYRSQDKHFNVENAFVYYFRRSNSLTRPIDKAFVRNKALIKLRGDRRDNILKVNGQIVECKHRYIATRAKLNLLGIEGHPLKIEFTQLCTHLSKHFGIPEECLLEQATIIRPLLTPNGYYEVNSMGKTMYFRTDMQAHNIQGQQNFMAAVGAIYNYIKIGSNLGPVRHIFKLSVINEDLVDVKEKFFQTIAELFNRHFEKYLDNNKSLNNCDVAEMIKLREEPGDNDQQILIKVDLFKDDFSSPCNQIPDQGQVYENDKAKMITFTAAILNINVEECKSELTVDLDVMTMAQVKTTDFRVLWQTYNQKSQRANCMYPVKWRHDLSFWDTKGTVTEENLHNMIRNISDDIISDVILVNEYVEKDVAKPRKSFCYREIYNSLCSPISHAQAHLIQNNIRLALEQHYQVELR